MREPKGWVKGCLAVHKFAALIMIYDVTIDGKGYRLDLERAQAGWRCKLDGIEVQMEALLTRPDVLSIIIAGRAYEIKRERSASGTHLWVGSTRYAADVQDPRSLRRRSSAHRDEKGPRRIVALMPGKVVRILVEEKTRVAAGQGVIVMEAMKMQNEIKSPKPGIVTKIVAVAGATVNAGDVLAIVE